MANVDPLAQAAVAEIRAGMTVGLGTGRAATRAIHALAQRDRAESLKLRCVATSRASDELGRSLGLAMEAMSAVERVDFLFDGADEVDEKLRMIKGRGGAMTREKIVAHAALRRVYLVQSSKVVTRLGAAAPLPIEVLRFGLASIRRRLQELGVSGPLRLDGKKEYETDNGNPVIDARIAPDLHLLDLAREIDQVPGVVGHGLFLREADVVLIEDDAGVISRRER